MKTFNIRIILHEETNWYGSIHFIESEMEFGEN